MAIDFISYQPIWLSYQLAKPRAGSAFASGRDEALPRVVAPQSSLGGRDWRLNQPKYGQNGGYDMYIHIYIYYMCIYIMYDLTNMTIVANCKKKTHLGGLI